MKYVNKDLLQAFEDGDCNVIIHQENTEGLNYFAGFAKSLHQKYPELTKLHQEYCKNDVFGTTYYYKVSKDKYIVNLYAQRYRGKPNNTDDNIDLRFEALHNSLQEVYSHIKDKSLKIGIPLISSGLASCKKLKGTMTDLEYFKKYIAPIVEEELKDLDVTVYYI